MTECPRCRPGTSGGLSIRVVDNSGCGSTIDGPGAGGGNVVGGGASGGRVDEARGRPTEGRGGVRVDVRLGRDEEMAGAVAYGCEEGATGVRGEKPPVEIDASSVNIESIPIKSSGVSVTSMNGSEMPLSSRECCREREEDRELVEFSDVGEVEAGDDGCVEAVEVEKEEEA